MNIREALLWGEKKLSLVETPALDAAVLLSWIMKKSKIFLYAHGEKIMSKKEMRSYLAAINRRAKHEPVAYLVGQKEFYGRTFAVNHHVLIPRPETELIIEIAKTIPADTVIDVGTGSGAIAVTLAKELKKPVTATDISAAALKIAKQNAKTLHAPVHFKHGHLLHSLADKKYRRLLVVANLPYLPTGRAKILSPDIKKYEPAVALYGGKDGLKLYRELLRELRGINAREWTMVAEIDSLQEKTFTTMAKKILPEAALSFEHDLTGRVRAAILKKT